MRRHLIQGEENNEEQYMIKNNRLQPITSMWM